MKGRSERRPPAKAGTRAPAGGNLGFYVAARCSEGYCELLIADEIAGLYGA